MDIETQKKLKPLMGRLKGLKRVLDSSIVCSEEFLADYNALVIEIGSLLDTDLSSFFAHEKSVSGLGVEYRGNSRRMIVNEKFYQFIFTLEESFPLTDTVAPVGRLFTSISDSELKERCEDILSAEDNYDRVINQATLVLEDRIRKKSKLGKGSFGVGLVNNALNTNLNKTILKISEDQEEHEGICHICRGIMMTYRNPTHHFITNQYSREDALRVCVFIDHILYLIDNSQLKEN